MKKMLLEWRKKLHEMQEQSARDAYKYLAEGEVVSLNGEPMVRIYFKESGNTYAKGSLSKIEDDYGNLTFFLKNMIWYQFHDQLEEDFQKMGYSAFDSPALADIVEKTETEEYEKMQDLLIRSMDNLQKNLKPEDFQKMDKMIKNYVVLLVNTAHEYKDSDPEIFDRKLRTIMSEVYDEIIALVNIKKL